MTTIDEKEILEIEKLKAELLKLPLDIDNAREALKQGSHRNILLTVAVTTAIVTAYFKFQVGL